MQIRDLGRVHGGAKYVKKLEQTAEQRINLMFHVLGSDICYCIGVFLQAYLSQEYNAEWLQRGV